MTAERAPPIPPLPRLVAVALLLAWATALAVALVLPAWSRPDDPGDGRVRQTIRVALACYFLTLGLQLRPGGEYRLTRLAWTLGWAAYVVHVLLAFDHAFAWSHVAAVEHTRERSGFGEGVYVSHLFTLLWTADVTWWWLAPIRHARRPAWIGWTLHGFMAFMVFNATVVFETGWTRWLAAAGYVIWAIMAWRKANRAA